MNRPDPRLNVYRPDLADLRLEGIVEAERFVTGTEARIAVPVASLRRAPDHSAGVDTELLFGDALTVFEREHGWAWAQAGRDGYVGYADETAIAMAQANPTHVVGVARTFAYPDADLKSPHLMALSMGSELAVTAFEEARGTRYATLATGGHVIARHIRPIADRCDDYVSVAEALAGTPYLWGGASAFGVDCSGLVQLSMRMCGRTVPRDTDMQAGSIGETVNPAAGLRRGDLAFWNGHVAIMRDDRNIVHADGRTMLVSREPLAGAIGRIGRLHGEPTGYRRP